ncbi:DUF4251 domain-containing protein [Flavobacterium sp. 83]|jgi:hypothetical protein|uniref:DUF4251 domain-containing protein n=1 Tax=Flavobacterium sp. 83 TaxID=1131812 RepID=UPI000553B836|nr:DUF4251 domain-containing protein [Flavobacterium sp. 83]
MKTKNIFLVLLFSTVVSISFAQEKTRKQLREDRKLEKKRQTEILMNSKEFVFVARNASPHGFRNVDLTSNTNYLKFQPDFIKSEMPFFGTAYNGAAYGGDGGLNFEGKPQQYTFKKEKKAYQIKAVVKGQNDLYTIFISIFFDGSASLSINSNNRSTISYSGEISPIEKKEIK